MNLKTSWKERKNPTKKNDKNTEKIVEEIKTEEKKVLISQVKTLVQMHSVN